MTNHPVCWRPRDSLGCGTSSAKLEQSQENWDKLVTLVVLGTRLLLWALGSGNSMGDHLGDGVDDALEVSHEGQRTGIFIHLAPICGWLKAAPKSVL